MTLKHTIVDSSELGLNCWLPAQYVDGVRCGRVMRCTYPDKKTCKAVDAEIAHLHKRRRDTLERAHDKISKLICED